MRTVLYIGEYVGRETYIKPGHLTIEKERMTGYGKGGNILTPFALCCPIPGLDRKIIALEKMGLQQFYPYRVKFNGLDPTEYLMCKTAPKGHPLLTMESVISWYKEQTRYMPGLYWVKDSFFPINTKHADLDKFLNKVYRDPKKYLQDF